MAVPTRVNRCRFIEWQPEAIHCMAANPNGTYVAVGRANGDIEIWNITNRWHMERVIFGSKEAPLTALVWSKTGRLFASSMNGTIFEVDLLRLLPININDSYGGAVWSMACCEHDKLIAVGCEDGRIRLYSFEKDDLEYEKAFMGSGGRVVSLGWHCDGQVLFSGNADGVINRWETSTGRCTSRITLDSFRSEKAIVWSLLVLDDFTIVSGDSMGNVHLWDGETGTLLQHFSHLVADVLTLATNSEQNVIFASGIDRQVIMLQPTETEIGPRWTYSYSHRSHTHDVRSLVVASAESKEYLISGGIDTQLVWYAVPSFAASRPNKVAPFPHREIVSMSPVKRLLLLQYSSCLDLWKIANVDVSLEGRTHCEKLPIPAGTENTHLLKLQITGGLNIVSSSISQNGEYIACSTTSELKLFRIIYAEDGSCQPRKVVLPDDCRRPSNVVAFTADSSLLVCGLQSGVIQLVDISTLTCVKEFHDHVEGNSEALPTTISSLAVSADARWLASADYNNDIHVFDLKSKKHHCSFPRPEHTLTGISFDRSAESLVVSTVQNQIISYDKETKALSKWSRENPDGVSAAVKKRTGRIKGIAMDPTRDGHLVAYSQRYFLNVDLFKTVKKRPREEATRKSGKKARKTSDADKEAAVGECQLVEKYRPLLFMGYIGEDEIVVVETPWLHILQKFPDVLYQRKYGK